MGPFLQFIKASHNGNPSSSASTTPHILVPSTAVLWRYMLSLQSAHQWLCQTALAPVSILSKQGEVWGWWLLQKEGHHDSMMVRYERKFNKFPEALLDVRLVLMSLTSCSRIPYRAPLVVAASRASHYATSGPYLQWFWLDLLQDGLQYPLLGQPEIHSSRSDNWCVWRWSLLLSSTCSQKSKDMKNAQSFLFLRVHNILYCCMYQLLTNPVF